MRPLVLLIILIGIVPAEAGAACLHNQPPQIAIEARTEALDISGAELPDGIEGRYSGAVAVDYWLKMEGQGDCRRVAALSVTFTQKPVIHISPRHLGTCRAAIIADHEKAHAAADRAALEQEAARVQRDLGFMLSGPITEDEAGAAIELYFQESARRYRQERTRLHAMIDSKEARAVEVRYMLHCR